MVLTDNNTAPLARLLPPLDNELVVKRPLPFQTGVVVTKTTDQILSNEAPRWKWWGFILVTYEINLYQIDETESSVLASTDALFMEAVTWTSRWPMKWSSICALFCGLCLADLCGVIMWFMKTWTNTATVVLNWLQLPLWSVTFRSSRDWHNFNAVINSSRFMSSYLEGTLHCKEQNAERCRNFVWFTANWLSPFLLLLLYPLPKSLWTTATFPVYCRIIEQSQCFKQIYNY